MAMLFDFQARTTHHVQKLSLSITLKAWYFPLMQVVALLYYTVSYFPGGTNGAKFVLKMAVGAFAQCLGGVQRAVTR